MYLRDLPDHEVRQAVEDMSDAGMLPLSAAEARHRLGDLPQGPDLREQVAETFGNWCAPQHPWDEDDGRPISNPLLFEHHTTEPFTPNVFVTGPQARSLAFDLSETDPWFGLMVATRAGVSPPDRTEALIRVAEADLAGLAEWAMTGSIHPGGLPCVDALLPAGAPPGAADEIFSALPLVATRAGLADLSYRTARETVVVSIGDHPEDHALGMLADRLATVGAWAPTHLLTGSGVVGDAVRRAVAATHFRSRMGGRTRRRILTSASLTASELREALDGIDLPDDVEFVSADALELTDRRFLGDPGSVARQSSHPVRVSGGRTSVLTPIDPPVPVAVTNIDSASWFVDVTIDGAVRPPARSALSGRVLQTERSVGDATANLVRSSAAGASYWSQAEGLVLAGSPREASFARPLVCSPSAMDAVSALARANGWRAEPSTAGRRAGRVADLWGSHQVLGDDLDGPVRSLLALLSHRRKPGPFEQGCAVGERSFVHFGGASAVLSEAGGNGARPTMDRLVTAGVLRRGLLLRCGRCDRLDFYGADEFGGTFRCKTCTADSVITAERWRDPPDEPLWYYALDPLVADFIEQHSDIPIRAARSIIDRSRRPGDASFEVELTIDGQKRPFIEIDFACIADGRLYIGEAKSNGRLQTGKRGLEDMARRLAEAAVKLNADGLVVAGTGSEWSPATIGALERALSQAASATGRPTPTAEVLHLED